MKYRTLVIMLDKYGFILRQDQKGINLLTCVATGTVFSGTIPVGAPEQDSCVIIFFTFLRKKIERKFLGLRVETLKCVTELQYMST